MIVYGTSKGITLKKGRVRNVICPECKKDTSMDYLVYGKYFHVYWIPFFSIGRRTIAVCTTCETDFEAVGFRDDIKKKFDREREKESARIPVWFFSGSIAICALIGYGFYGSIESANTEKDYLKHPKAGDVYRVTADAGYFSTFKVNHVRKDSVYVFANDLQTDNQSAVNKINTPEHYKELYAFSRKSIDSLYQKGEIYQIDRP